MVKDSLKDAVLAKESSQPQSSYEVVAMLTEFELKKILIDKMDKRSLTRVSGRMRTASVAAKTCQGDSSEFYLITGTFKTKKQQQYEHVGPEVTRSQEGKRSQDDDKRLCLVDDLKEVLNHIHIKSKIQVKA
ncbi:hypothetical protein Tco_0315979 [Tanacetum coccineum]